MGPALLGPVWGPVNTLTVDPGASPMTSSMSSAASPSWTVVPAPPSMLVLLTGVLIP